MRQRALAMMILLSGAGWVWAASTPSLKKAPPPRETNEPPAKTTGKTTSAPRKSDVPPLPPPPSSESGNLGSMEVTGQAKDKVAIERVTPEIKVDIKELVDSVTDKTEKLLEQSRPIPSEEDFRRFDRIDSQQTARPWLPDLVEPPLVSFQPAPAQTTVVAWRLEVADDKGDIVHTIVGKGNPVKEIVWDGFNRDGKMIRVSSAYSFRFITVDEFKDTHTTLGKAFVLRHLKYKDKKNVVVEIASSYLFENDKINLEALPILERTLDVLREYSGYPFALEFQTLDPEGEEVKRRQKAVTEKIAMDLLLSPDSIKYTYGPIKDRSDVLRFVIKAR